MWKKVSTLTSTSHTIAQNLCLCQCLSLQSISPHTQRCVTEQHYQCILVTRNQARKHGQNDDRQEFTRVRKYWDWELCHLPSVENKTKHLNRFPHISLPRFNGNRSWRWVCVLKCWIYFFKYALFRFLTVVPTLFWSGSELLAAISIVLKYFQNSHFYTPYTQAELDFPHTSCSVLNKQNTGVFYTTDGQFTAEQGKETKWKLQFLLTVCPQNLKKIQLSNLSVIQKANSTVNTWQLFSQELQIYMGESITSKRSFALSCPQNPGMTRAVFELRITRNPLLPPTELIHLTSFSNSTREEGGKETKSKQKTNPKPKPHFLPRNKTKPPVVILEWMSEKAEENKSLPNSHFLRKTSKPF